MINKTERVIKNKGHDYKVATREVTGSNRTGLSEKSRSLDDFSQITINCDQGLYSQKGSSSNCAKNHQVELRNGSLGVDIFHHWD